MQVKHKTAKLLLLSLALTGCATLNVDPVCRYKAQFYRKAQMLAEVYSARP